MKWCMGALFRKCNLCITSSSWDGWGERGEGEWGDGVGGYFIKVGILPIGNNISVYSDL